MLEFLSRRSASAKEAARSDPAPPPPPLDQTKPQQTVPASSIRETINLLESDLGAMIGEVYRACELVRHEAGELRHRRPWDYREDGQPDIASRCREPRPETPCGSDR